MDQAAPLRGAGSGAPRAVSACGGGADLTGSVRPHTGSHLQRARELAQLIARQAPLGVQGTLANAGAGRSHGPDAAREHLLSLLPGILHSQDAAEGLRSFTERREGRFTGH